MCDDSFFDNIEVVQQPSQTFRKPPSICKSLEKVFAACNNAPTIKKPTNCPFNELKRQTSKTSKSFLYQRQQTETSKSYLNHFKKLNIQLENDASIANNLRQKTQSSHNSHHTHYTQGNPSSYQNNYQISLVSLLRQRASSKQQNSLASICRTINDETRLKVSSTHRSSVYQPTRIPDPNNSKATQSRPDSLNNQNMRKSNSVYMQEFRKMFSKRNN